MVLFDSMDIVSPPPFGFAAFYGCYGLKLKLLLVLITTSCTFKHVCFLWCSIATIFFSRFSCVDAIGLACLSALKKKKKNVVRDVS
jgi:hypothetical protein